MKVERCTYDVMTPSAARGILEAIYWHPGLRWKIDRIYVKKPIRFTSVRRNEVKSKLSASNALSVYNGAKKDLYISTKAVTDFKGCRIRDRSPFRDDAGCQ